MKPKIRSLFTGVGLLLLVTLIFLSSSSPSGSVQTPSTTSPSSSTSSTSYATSTTGGGGSSSTTPTTTVSSSTTTTDMTTTTNDTTTTTTTSSAKPIGYTDFLYVYPSNGAATPAYADLIALKNAFSRVPMVAIVNDGNGGGTSSDSNYVSAINGMRAVGIVVIGYVYCFNSPPYATTTGWRNLIGPDSAIGLGDNNRGLEQAIDSWAAHYKIDGIFFDNAVPGYPSFPNSLNSSAQGWPGHTLLQYYQAAVAYGKSHYSYTYNMANVGKVYPAMIGVVDSLSLEDGYPANPGPLPTPLTLQSWTTGVGGTSANFNIVVYSVTTVPSVAYLRSIQGYVSFVFTTDTWLQPSTSYQDALLANLNQLISERFR